MQKITRITPLLMAFFINTLLLSFSVQAASVQLQHESNLLLVDVSAGDLVVQASGLGANNKSVTKLVLQSLKFNYQNASRWEIKSAGADAIELLGYFPASVDFYHAVTDTKARLVKLSISKVKGGFRFHSTPTWGRQITIELQDLGDHIFGLSEALQPDNSLSPDLREGVIHVDVNAEDASFQENYASAYSAFYMSSLGYAAFFDTFARGIYKLAVNGKHTIHHDAAELDWYLFFGDDGREIHQAYYSVIGHPKTVPAWGLGPIGWRDNNESSDEILADIEKLNKLKIPFSSWFVDRPYSDGAHAWSKMNFSKNFASPGKWISRLRNEHNLEFMTWTSTAFFGDTPLNTHLDGDFSYLDLSDPKSYAQFKKALKNKQHRYGVKGHKIDRADELFPVYEKWHDETVLPAYRRNKNTYLTAKVHDEALRESWADDQLTFMRSAIHRAQPYLSAIWAGDPRTSWEGLRANYANAARSAFMGFPVWGTDVGGYQGEGYIPEDLYIRWMQAGSMSGMFEIKLDGAGGSGRDRMPWQYGANLQNIFRQICEERMLLVPYLYSLIHTSGVTGTLMQPLAYRHLDDENTYAKWDQFYVGDAILVAPVFDKTEKRSVYLPKGEWRDYDVPAQRFTGARNIEINAPLNKLPRFVRANSLFVTGNLYQGSDKLWNKTAKQLTIHVFPGDKGSKNAFNYVDMLDGDTLKTLSVANSGKRVLITSPAVSYSREFEVVLDKKPEKVSINGKAIKLDYSVEKTLLIVRTENVGDVELVISL